MGVKAEILNRVERDGQDGIGSADLARVTDEVDGGGLGRGNGEHAAKGDR